MTALLVGAALALVATVSLCSWWTRDLPQPDKARTTWALDRFNTRARRLRLVVRGRATQRKAA